MSTYTVAKLDDLLIAVVPDGDDIDDAIQQEFANANLHYAEIEDCEIIEGLQLADELPENVNVEVIHEGSEFGWLYDEKSTHKRFAFRTVE